MTGVQTCALPICVRLTTAELLARIDKAPESVSPNALLRPVVQDSILPTAVYVGGPAELAYLAQSKVIYDRIRNDRNSPTVGLQFRALLNSPDVASHLTSMGAVLRFKSAMPENLKEFAIIVLAREWNSDIEWTDRKSTRLNSSHMSESRMPSSA